MQLPVIQPAAAGRAAPPPVDEFEPLNWGPARCLMAATAVAGLVGVPLGLLLAVWAATGRAASVPWVGLVQTHGQTQLFGWLGLAILGVTFHAMAHLFRAAEPPAATTHTVLVLQLAGIVLRIAAPLVPGAEGAPGAWLLLASALAFLGAFGLTLEAHMRTLPRRAPGRRAPSILPRFLLVGLLLWFGALLVNLDGAIRAVRFGPVAAGAIGAGHDALMVAMVANGLALVAAGMSLRVVVGWLDLPMPDLARASAAWWPLVGGVLLRAARPAFEELAPAAAPALVVAGSLLWALGVFWYLPALRGLWAPDVVRPGGGAGGEADPPLAWFVRTAYFWFAVTGLLALLEAILTLAAGAGLAGASPATVADAGRHALLLGYLGTLTAGLTGRLPTRFLDVGDSAVVATATGYRAAWVLLVAAGVLRAGAPFAGSLRSEIVAASGVAGAAGLWCLLAVLARIAIMARANERRFLATLQHARGA